jgi:hypothetical protein
MDLLLNHVGSAGTSYESQTETIPEIHVMGFNRRKMEARRAAAAEKEAAVRRATEAQVLEDAGRMIAAWNERQAKRMPMLFSPTIGCALKARQWFLWVCCPACRTTQAVDLRTVDRHPWSAISSLIAALSCRACRPHAPFAESSGSFCIAAPIQTPTHFFGGGRRMASPPRNSLPRPDALAHAPASANFASGCAQPARATAARDYQINAERGAAISTNGIRRSLLDIFCRSFETIDDALQSRDL